MRKEPDFTPNELNTRSYAPDFAVSDDTASHSTIAWSEVFGFLGIVALLSWLWALLFSTGSLNAFDGGIARGSAQALHMAGLVAGLLVFVSRKNGCALAFAGRPIAVVASVLVGSAIVATVLSGFAFEHVLVTASLWILEGVICSFAIVNAARFLTCHQSRSVLAILSGAGMCAAGVALLFSFLEDGANVVAACIMVPGSLCFFRIARICDPKIHPTEDGVSPEARATQSGEGRLLTRAKRNAPFALGLALYGIVFGFVCSMGNNLYADSVGPASALVATMVPNTVLMVVALFAKRLVGFSLLQAITALTAISFIPLLILGSNGYEIARIAAHMVLLACINGFFVMAFTLLAKAAQGERTDSTRNYLFGQLVYFAGLLLGWILGTIAYDHAGLGSTDLHVVTASMIAALILCILAFGSLKGSGIDAGGEEYGGSEKTARICTAFDLSKREAELFFLIVRGYENKDIEKELFISKNTVKSHIYHIYTKLDVHSKEELMDFVDTWQPH